MSAPLRIRLALVFLALLHGAALLAPYLAVYPYEEQHRDFPLASPTPVHLIDFNRVFHFRPFVYAGGDPTRTYFLHFFRSGRLVDVDSPGVLFILGTDSLGRDVFSRLLYGGRISLFTGLFAAALSLGLGILIGTVAGYAGGAADTLLMRTGELTMALPWLYLLLAARAALPLHLSAESAFLLLIAIIGLVGWVRPARLIRGVVLSAKERDYVTAARSFGAGPFYLLRRHILPFTAPVAITQATLLIPKYILAEISLSFLGLGMGEPVPSWGNMLADAMQYQAMVSHPWLLAPGLAVIPVLLGYLFLADACPD